MASSWDDQDEKTHVFDNERPEGVPSGSERWYISPDGKTKEVLTAAEIIERARSGALSDSTLVWRDGLTDWTRLDSVPELMQAVNAFRSSAPATLVRDTVGESAPSVSGGSRGALPPIPGPPSTNRASTSGPLPPPPALPPMPHAPAGQARTSDPSQEASTIAIALPVSKPREPQPTLSSVASQAGQLIANSSRDALGRASGFAGRAMTLLERDVKLPEIGVVKGRLLAQIGLGLLVLILLLIVIAASGGEETSQAVSTSGSVVVSNEVRGDGVDLDEDAVVQPRANGEQPLEMGELESLEPVRSKVSASNAERAVNSTTGKPAKKGKEFDVLAAKSALSVAAAKAATCKQGPKGEGSVRVKIAPSGKVVSATITTAAFQGTAAGNCVQQVFRQATVPPFVGEDKTVFKKFSIN